MLNSLFHTSLIKPVFHALTLGFQDAAVKGSLPNSSAGGGAVGFGLLITQILNIVLTIAAIAVLFYLILGAFEWITSGGDKGKAESARNKMTQAVIGLVITVSVVAIMMFVQQLLGICIVDLGNTCTAPPPAAPVACTTSCRSALVCTAQGGSPIAGACGSGICCSI